MNETKPKIMVVDDEPRMLSTITVILEDAGYDVCGVEDGYKAIELAEQGNFALVFMDISLPGIDGVEAFKQIKSVSPGTPVIMMTGSSLAMNCFLISWQTSYPDIRGIMMSSRTMSNFVPEFRASRACIPFMA